MKRWTESAPLGAKRVVFHMITAQLTGDGNEHDQHGLLSRVFWPVGAVNFPHANCHGHARAIANEGEQQCARYASSEHDLEREASTTKAAQPASRNGQKRETRAHSRRCRLFLWNEVIQMLASLPKDL